MNSGGHADVQDRATRIVFPDPSKSLINRYLVCTPSGEKFLSPRSISVVGLKLHESHHTSKHTT